MKKFLFSAYTKAFAVILFLASLTLGVFSAIHGAELLNQENDYIYDFGTSMEDSWYFQHLVSLPENAVLGAFWEFTYADNSYNTGETEPATVSIYRDTDSPEAPTETEATVEPTISMESHRKKLSQKEQAQLLQRIGEYLEALPYLDYIEYYVNLNGTVFSNNGVTDPTTLTQGLYKYFALDKAGSMEYYSGRNSYDMPWIYDYGLENLQVDPLIIATRIRPEYVNSVSLLWARQENILYSAGGQILACVLGFLLSLIYLVCVCGRDGQGNRKSSWVDRIWAEFHLAAMGAIAFGALYFGWAAVEAAFEQEFPMDGAYVLCGVLLSLAGGLILCSLLSLIRNLKAGLFAKRCGVLILLKKLLSWLWAFCNALWRGLRYCIRTFASLRGVTFTVFQIGLLLLYTIGTLFLVVLIGEGVVAAIIPLILLYVGAAFLLALKGKDLDGIQKGAARIRSGDLSHQIPDPKCPHLKPLAGDLNHIAKGLDTSLAARMKAERMKTELITNVSHDLKTPLTSILTYTELLSRVEDLPEEARDYLRIIEEKGRRLESLTRDLFDISKVQSGNEEVRWEVLDAALLLEQSLAEETGEDGEGPLQFCRKSEEGLTFMGDGGKLSRVLGNLIQNAKKYALPGTRVFLSAYSREGRVVIECKNTSAYPLDFSPEEILGRFVRGDSSRSTEGNGLGLPIAKSYTELCGGDFRLILDGDLFKVLLSFPGAQ